MYKGDRPSHAKKLQDVTLKDFAMDYRELYQLLEDSSCVVDRVFKMKDGSILSINNCKTIKVK